MDDFTNGVFNWHTLLFLIMLRFFLFIGYPSSTQLSNSTIWNFGSDIINSDIYVTNYWYFFSQKNQKNTSLGLLIYGPNGSWGGPFTGLNDWKRYGGWNLWLLY